MVPKSLLAFCRKKRKQQQVRGIAAAAERSGTRSTRSLSFFSYVQPFVKDNRNQRCAAGRLANTWIHFGFQISTTAAGASAEDSLSSVVDPTKKWMMMM